VVEIGINSGICATATTWSVNGTSGTLLIKTGERGKLIDEWEIKEIKLKRLSKHNEKASAFKRL